MEEHAFTFERGRGVVWVCDIQNSSKYLNDNASAEAIEEFLPRLQWLGRVVVRIAGGDFVKWTGDGFLAWFPIELHRNLGNQAATVLQVIWHLTAINNVTALGIEGITKFRLRHGLTVEHDALITKVSDGDAEHTDIMGRSVVLAFRLSGISASFPGVITQREIVEAIDKENASKITFKRLALSADEKLKHFKGERWGTKNLFQSAERRPRTRTLKSLLRLAKKAIERAENTGDEIGKSVAVTAMLVEELQSGPRWANQVLDDYALYLREDMLGSLKTIVRHLENVEKNSKEETRTH